MLQTLSAVIRKVVPLNLLHPQDETFTPEHCRTLHDVVRYAYEFSLREMFQLTENVTRYQGAAVPLETGLPLKVRLLDLGGGLRRGWGLKVRPPQVLSRPFQAFWQGLTAGVWPPEGGTIPLQGYGLLSADYMNFRLRLNAALVTVEAYISGELNDNHLSFGFQGGDSTEEGSAAPARHLMALLKRRGFTCRHRGETLEARLGQHPPEDLAGTLAWLGHLTGHVVRWDPAPWPEDAAEAWSTDLLNEPTGGVN